MPLDSDIIHIASVFSGAVVLVHSYELRYSIDELRSLGVDVLHIPVDDFSASQMIFF